ncbi:hypothetical protein [Nocardioides sp.]|nr:hypothetical protein [Nocardioides sp.]HXH79621.1 hypothetical protein [Nocardioides sp.]
MALDKVGGDIEQGVGDLVWRDEQMQGPLVVATHLPVVNGENCSYRP